MAAQIGELQTSYNTRGTPTHSLELWHEGLKKHRLIRDGDVSVIKRKAELQIEEWQLRWNALASRQQALEIRYTGKRRQEEMKTDAAARTQAAQDTLNGLESILTATLSVNDAVDWDTLKDTSKFAEAMPRIGALPQRPKLASMPRESLAEDSRYKPNLSFLDKIFSSPLRY
jgi:restriction system protein